MGHDIKCAPSLDFIQCSFWNCPPCKSHDGHKHNFPSTYKVGTKQISPPRTGSGMVVMPTQNLHNSIVPSTPPPVKTSHSRPLHIPREEQYGKIEWRSKQTGKAPRAICHGTGDKHCHSSSWKGLQKDRHVHVKCCLVLLGRSFSIEPYFPSTCGWRNKIDLLTAFNRTLPYVYI